MKDTFTARIFILMKMTHGVKVQQSRMYGLITVHVAERRWENSVHRWQ
jgi:hypothetical protein